MTSAQSSADAVRPILDRLSTELAELRLSVEALRARLDDFDGRVFRADAKAQDGEDRTHSLERRADRADMRADASEDLASAHGERLETLEERMDVDEAMIDELQADGVLSQEHVAQLHEALRSSRKIGAAVGIVMATHRVNEEHAFHLLSKASQDTNRKLRLLAEDVLLTGDVSVLRSR